MLKSVYAGNIDKHVNMLSNSHFLYINWEYLVLLFYYNFPILQAKIDHLLTTSPYGSVKVTII